MTDFETLGAFYLGRPYDQAAGAPRPEPLLYDSRHLTTHAVVLGMTGSGKTGLGVALLEEAAIDGVPAIVIDPKGDLANLLLTFPELRPQDFAPWVDREEARRQGITPEALAEKTAARWRQGLADWGQEPARIARLRAAVDVTVYTPGARAGVPLALLRSFAAPPPALRAQPDLLRERIGGTVAGLLGLLEVDADPTKSREGILLASLLERAWSEGRDLDLAALVRQVQAPPFDRVGVFDLETFYPAKERMTLAMALNGLLASPGFAAWTEGEPLDVARLLTTPAGKPRLSILSIAHLSDAERMFFVTALLGEVVAWMRTQAGTSSLRAILYMDEIFGYFPPTAAPPSKRPMLTLLKQGRAFGLGVVLCTQNPVDLDYKGLANAGTWFIGRLQTERDKLRVLDGLEGTMAAHGAAADRAALDTLLSGLGNRVFLMNDVHAGAPVLFQTRWALSYLRGPLDRDELRALTEAQGRAAAPTAPAAAAPAAATPRPAPAAEASRPVLPPGLSEFFLPAEGPGPFVYRPAAFASGRARYANAKAGVDRLDTIALLAPLDEGGDGADVAWPSAEELDPDALALEKEPRGGAGEGARFAPVPGAALRKATHDGWRKAFTLHLVQERPIVLFKSAAGKELSRPGESEAEFRARLALRAREARDAEVDRLRKRYAPKVQALQDRLRRAEAQVDRERTEAQQQGWETAVSAGLGALGALLGGGRRSGLGGARAAMRGAGRTAKAQKDVARAEEEAATLRDRLAALEAELEGEFRAIHAAEDAAAAPLERVEVRPKKSDVSVGTIALVWVPHREDGTPAWR